MNRRIQLASVLAAGAAIVPHDGFAHAVAGARFFVNTNLIDDPGVADEATLPQISLQSPDGKTWITDANVEFDKTITPHLGFGVGTDWRFVAHDMADGGKAHAGFADTDVTLKYNWITLPRHEFMSSVAVTQAFGRAGTVGIESGYDTTTVSGFFGKGLGDLPWAPIRPFAVTGELDYSVPDSVPSAGGAIRTWSGGLTLQYSIPYLQSQVKNIGITGLAANLTPLVELAWTSAASATALPGSSQPTSFLLGTGAVWTGTTSAVSAEMLWPLNGAAGHGIGVIGQFHLFLDDLLPNTLGKPLLAW